MSFFPETDWHHGDGCTGGDGEDGFKALLWATSCRNRLAGARLAEGFATREDAATREFSLVGVEEDEEDEEVVAVAVKADAVDVEEKALGLRTVLECWYLLGVPDTRPARRLEVDDDPPCNNGFSKEWTVPGSGSFCEDVVDCEWISFTFQRGNFVHARRLCKRTARTLHQYIHVFFAHGHTHHFQD